MQLREHTGPGVENLHVVRYTMNNLGAQVRPKLIYFLTSLFLFIVSTIFLGLFLSAQSPSKLYSFITYTTVGFYLLIITFVLVPVTFCTNIHALIKLFQKREKKYTSWQEREKKAALDIGIFYVKVRKLSLSFALHIYLGALLKDWITNGSTPIWGILYVISLLFLDVTAFIFLIIIWKKGKVGIGIIGFHITVILVGCYLGSILF